MKKSWHSFKNAFIEALHYVRSFKADGLTSLLVLLFIFSVLDAFFTLMWIQSGLAIEANPILNELVKDGPFSFVATKIALTGLGCIGLYRARHHSVIARRSIVLLTIGYSALIIYHIIGALLSIDPGHLPNFISDMILFFS